VRRRPPLPPSGSIVTDDLDVGAYKAVIRPQAAKSFNIKALLLSIGSANPFARQASLDKRGTTGRRAALVHLDASGRLVPPALADVSGLDEKAQRALQHVQRRSSLITRTNDVAVEAIEELLRCRCWGDGDWLMKDDADVLIGWASKLKDCSRYVEVWSCPCCATTRTKSNCCACAPCSREQRRRSRQWVARAERVYERLPNAHGRRWRLLTLSLRKTGNLKHDVEATISMRAALMRLLRSKFGMKAGFGAIEQGDDSNIHLHALVFCDYVERAKLQSWLRSRDCTVRGCKHPADDRCDSCRAGRCSCIHPDAGRVRCNGSWVVNVQAIKGKKGIYEAIKYAAAPVALQDVPEPGLPATNFQVAYAERVLRFYLAMQGRHRVETYGEAKDDVASPMDDDDLPLDGEMHPCPKGNALEFVSFGVNQNGTYVWYRALFGST